MTEFSPYSPDLLMFRLFFNLMEILCGYCFYSKDKIDSVIKSYFSLILRYEWPEAFNLWEILFKKKTVRNKSFSLEHCAATFCFSATLGTLFTVVHYHLGNMSICFEDRTL